MPYHLLLDSPTGANWRVPDGADPHGLLASIERAMRDGDVIDVVVQVADDPPKNVSLKINGAALATAALVELP